MCQMFFLINACISHASSESLTWASEEDFVYLIPQFVALPARQHCLFFLVRNALYFLLLRRWSWVHFWNRPSQLMWKPATNLLATIVYSGFHLPHGLIVWKCLPISHKQLRFMELILLTIFNQSSWVVDECFILWCHVWATSKCRWWNDEHHHHHLMHRRWKWHKC